MKIPQAILGAWAYRIERFAYNGVPAAFVSAWRVGCAEHLVGVSPIFPDRFDTEMLQRAMREARESFDAKHYEEQVPPSLPDGFVPGFD